MNRLRGSGSERGTLGAEPNEPGDGVWIEPVE